MQTPIPQSLVATRLIFCLSRWEQKGYFFLFSYQSCFATRLIFCLSRKQNGCFFLFFFYPSYFFRRAWVGCRVRCIWMKEWGPSTPVFCTGRWFYPASSCRKSSSDTLATNGPFQPLLSGTFSGWQPMGECRFLNLHTKHINKRFGLKDQGTSLPQSPHCVVGGWTSWRVAHHGGVAQFLGVAYPCRGFDFGPYFVDGGRGVASMGWGVKQSSGLLAQLYTWVPKLLCPFSKAAK